ncbi:MAG TPA: aldehyde dehydrogenase family protein, partial [Puia sp.]
DVAVRRKEPVPVYAEMGSVNPVFFLPDAIKEGGEMLAGQFAASVTLGSGQFCTNPGVCVFLNNEESKWFIKKVADAMSASILHPLLTKGITDAYTSGVNKQKKLHGAEQITKSMNTLIEPNIISVHAKDVLVHTDYFEEVFGPSTLAVLVDNYEEMYRLAETMPGQLTATIHATENNSTQAIELLDRLTYKAGRVVMNGFPTGVEVSHAMVHGGPFPATTDSRVTSVGATSIYRFTRPVCYQNIVPLLMPGIVK